MKPGGVVIFATKVDKFERYAVRHGYRPDAIIHIPVGHPQNPHGRSQVVFYTQSGVPISLFADDIPDTQ